MLTETDRQALAFLGRVGSDCPGATIDSEEQLTALLVFSGLHRRGLVSSERTDDGPMFRLTAAGRTALAETDGGGDAT